MTTDDIAARVAALRGDGVAAYELVTLRELVARVSFGTKNLPLAEAGRLVLDVLADKPDELPLYERRTGGDLFDLLSPVRVLIPDAQRMPWHKPGARLPSRRCEALDGLALWWREGAPGVAEAARRFDRLAVVPQQAALCFGMPVPTYSERLRAAVGEAGPLPAHDEAMPSAAGLLADPVLRDFPKARRKRADAEFCALVAGLYGALKAADVVGPYLRLAETFECSETHLKNCVREHEGRGGSASRKDDPGVDLAGAFRSMVGGRRKP